MDRPHPRSASTEGTETTGAGLSPAPVDPFAVVGVDELGDQVLGLLETLRVQARGLKDYAETLVDRIEGMREMVLSLSSEGLARRELEERLAVLEAERDVLARQLGKVRRENEEDLSLARERIRALETELSLAASRPGGMRPGEERSLEELESRESSSFTERPAVERVGARARREALRSRPPRAGSSSVVPPPRGDRDGKATAPQGMARESGLDEGWGAEGLAGEPEDLRTPASTAVEGADGSFAELLEGFGSEEDSSGPHLREPGAGSGLELDFSPDELELPPAGSGKVGPVRPRAGDGGAARDVVGVKTSSPSVKLALEDLLTSYLDEK